MMKWHIAQFVLALVVLLPVKKLITQSNLIQKSIGHLRDMSPLWEMFKDGIDLDSIEWAAH